jgi:20S proteasome subunit beta 7
VAPPALGEAGGREPTFNPYLTGTSVEAFKYKGGVLVASDTLGSYGSTKRYKSVQRVARVNARALVGASGEISDFQHTLKDLEALVTEDACHDDGVQLQPREVFSYLCRSQYQRRSKMDPLWNSLVVAGWEGGAEGGRGFLGTVDLLGVHYEDDTVATGFGNHLARPLFREVDTTQLWEAEAIKLMEDALRVCYYRDKNSINKFQIGKVTAEGVSISEPYSLSTDWNFQSFQNPTQFSLGSW